MSSQNGLPTRRTFLERSALGAGSLLFAPLFLDSCTDHNLPDPDPNPDPWPILDSDIDWNDDAKIVVIAGLELIPYAGHILGPLTDILWPNTKEDVWGEIKTQVEALIDQKLSDLVYDTVHDDLNGLHNAIILYLNELKNGNAASIQSQWITTRTVFVTALPHFQSNGYQTLLLPLFAQFANMYLTILRDGVAFGKSWGRTDADHLQDVTDLKKSIQDFTNYALDTYYIGISHLPIKRDDHLCEPFRTINRFERQMTLTVLDYSTTWPYYDVTLYPKGAKVVLTREIYSDPFGTCDDSGMISLAKPDPTQGPTNLTVWGYDRIDAIQLTYPTGSGPGGVTQTPRMGDQKGGTNQPPYGGTFTLSPANPIVGYDISYGDIVNSLRFYFYDKTATSTLGGRNGQGNNSVSTRYQTDFISRIHVNGQSNFYYSVDCVVFGIKNWQPPAATLRATRAIYVRSPKEHSIADFAKAFPNLAIPADLITDALKAARRAYWAQLEARAKALK